MKRTVPHLGRVGLLLLAAAGPWCEAGAGARATEALARRTGGGFASWDLDTRGLQLWDLQAVARGTVLAATHARIGVDGDGVVIELDGLSASAAPEDAQPPAAAPSDDTTSATPAPARDRFRIANRGVPIRIVGSGEITIPSGGVVATIVDPIVRIDRHGWPTLQAGGEVHGLPGGAVALRDVVARRSAGAWQVAGTASRRDDRPVAFEAELGDARTDVLLRAGDGTLVVGRERGTSAARVVADDFPVAAVGGSLLDPLASWGITANDATLDGTIDVTFAGERRFHGEGVSVAGLVVEDRRVASGPIRFGAIDLEGDAALTDDGIDLQLVVGHRDATVAIGGRIDRSGVAIEADLAPLPCDALVASLPQGTVDGLAGVHMLGEIAATAALRLEFAALDRARANPTDIVDPDATATFPGELRLDFPFLERCRTVTDPTNVDLGALRGPYRHRFADDDGRIRERVFAAGAADFAPLGTIPRVASAFIALEDMHFWYHDGFDREQIARAFWHNVVSGRVRRGASTISQQTARNLWLGIDRSIARKLQEAYLTSRIEAEVSKTRILELYVNLIELGPGVFGVDAASRFYFGVPASELDALQAVHLASLAPAPRTYAERWKSGKVDDAWMAELRGHLRRMHRNRMISEAELRAGLRGDLRLLAR